MDTIDLADMLPLAERVEKELWARSYHDGWPPASTFERASYREGMAPHRARLARFVQWQHDTLADLAEAEHARDRMTEALGVEPVTARAIDDLVAADATGLLAWARGAANAFSGDMLRRFERAKLEKQLEGDRHQAEVAREALGEADFEVAVLTRAVEVLAERHAIFVRAAVREEVDRLAAVYVEQAHALAGTWKLMRSAASAAGLLGAADEFTLPVFDVPTFRGDEGAGAPQPMRFGFGAAELRHREALWGAFATELTHEPGADVRPYLTATLPTPQFGPGDGSEMDIFSHSAAAVGAERFIVTIAPAGDLPEQDPPAEWLDADGRPENFRVTFRFGQARAPSNLAQFMIARGLAHAEPVKVAA